MKINLIKSDDPTLDKLFSMNKRVKDINEGNEELEIMYQVMFHDDYDTNNDCKVKVMYWEDDTKPMDDFLELVKTHFEEYGYPTKLVPIKTNDLIKICKDYLEEVECPTKLIPTKLNKVVEKTTKVISLCISNTIYLLEDMMTPKADMYQKWIMINELYKKILNYGK